MINRLYVLKDSTNQPVTDILSASIYKDILSAPIFGENDTEYQIEVDDSHRLIFIDKNTLKVSRNFQIYPYNNYKYFTSFADAEKELKR